MSETPPSSCAAADEARPGRDAVRTAAAVVIAAVAVAFVLYFGREVFIPIALSVVFMALLRPVVRALERLHVPTPLAALIVVLGSLALLVAPGSRWPRRCSTGPRRRRRA